MTIEVLGLSLLAWVAASTAVAIGAMLQGSLGFGAGLVSAPVLVLLDPRMVPGAVIGMAVPLGLLILWRERHALDTGVVRWAIAGRIPGAVVGSLIVVALGARSLSILFAIAILVAVIVSLAGFRARQTNTTMLIAGFVSGVSGTATSVGGPPIAIVLQNRSGPELRAALSAFFAIGSIMSLVLLAAVGRYGRHEIGLSAMLFPAAIAGFAISARTNRLLDRGFTRPAVLAVAAASAVAILIRSW